MKFEFNENQHWSSITLTPETMEEAGQLMRMAKSTKRAPAEISFSFSEGEPFANIQLQKTAKNLQNNFINNKKQ